MICPQCRSGDCLRSRRGGIADFLATWILLRPWRCLACDVRFYAWRVAVAFSRFVHCPRCGNFDLDLIARDRVDEGTLVLAKRVLKFPAYRCDPCRQKFFSARP